MDFSSEVQMESGVWLSAAGSFRRTGVLSGVSFYVNPFLPLSVCPTWIYRLHAKYKMEGIFTKWFWVHFRIKWCQWKGTASMSSTVLLLIFQSFCGESFLNTSELSNKHYNPNWKEQLFKWQVCHLLALECKNVLQLSRENQLIEFIGSFQWNTNL